MKISNYSFMYLFTLLLLLGSVSIKTHAQENEGPRHELSMNMTDFVLRFAFQPNNQIDIVDQTFLFSYKLFNPYNNSAIRIGLNAFYNNVSDGGGMDFTVNETRFLLFSIGYEMRKKLSSKTNFFYGLELFSTEQFEDAKFSNTGPFPIQANLKSRNLLIGLSPVMGFSYQINPNLKLFTESYVRLLYQKNTVTFFPKDQPKRELEKSEGGVFKLIAPTQVHLAFSF
jgi:hypothetical protein